MGCQTAFPGPAPPKLIRNSHWSLPLWEGACKSVAYHKFCQPRALGRPSGRFSRHHAPPKGRCARPRASLAHKLRASNTDIAASKKEHSKTEVSSTSLSDFAANTLCRPLCLDLDTVHHPWVCRTREFSYVCQVGFQVGTARGSQKTAKSKAEDLPISRVLATPAGRPAGFE